MGFIATLEASEVPELADVFAREELHTGFVSNTSLALSRNPVVVRALGDVLEAGLWSGSLSQQHRYLLVAGASAVSGSLYTLSHAGLALEKSGMPGTMLLDALGALGGDDGSTSVLDAPTRMSVEFSRDIASIPNRVSPAHFEGLSRHYGDDEIIEMAFVACLQGLLHRITGMIGAQLEPGPLDWATRTLGPQLVLPSVAPGASPASGGLGGERLRPLSAADVPELAPDFARFAGSYVLNSFLVMARRPDLVRVMMSLWSAMLGTRQVAPDIVYMASWIASYATGCQYCQAHTSLNASKSGVDPAKIENLWTFESSPLFSDEERVALRLALAGAVQPSAMTPELSSELHRAFDERSIVDLATSISSFGFYNRWNDTFATPLEDQPFEFAAEHLASSGWNGGPHRAT